MHNKILSAITNPAETASSLSNKLNVSNLSDKVIDNYSFLSNKFSESCPGFSSGLTSTRSTITSTFSNGSTYIYSLPNSVGNRIYSYTSMFQPVDAEEREITRTPPNDNLGEGVIRLSAEREEIVNHILNLYSCKPSKECFKYYDNDVVFEDSLIYATGLDNLKPSFYIMPKLFVKSTTINYKVLENTPNVLRIDLNQKYTLPYVGRAFVQHCVIVLELNAENKITKHSDFWSGNPTGTDSILTLRKAIARLAAILISIPEN